MPVLFLTADAFILIDFMYITENWLKIHLNCPPWCHRSLCRLSATWWPSSQGSTVWSWFGACAWFSLGPWGVGAVCQTCPIPVDASPWPKTGCPSALATPRSAPGTPAGMHSPPLWGASGCTWAGTSPGLGLGKRKERSCLWTPSKRADSISLRKRPQTLELAF